MTECKSAPTSFLSGFKLEDGKETPLVDTTLYKHLVGSLLYLTHSRPNLSYEVGIVSRFMQEPRELHWKDARHILRYVQVTITFGIHYEEKSTLDLIEFTDSYWVDDSTNHKSTSSYSLSLGSGPICLLSKNKAGISLSSSEVEYRGVVNEFRLCGYNIFSLSWAFSFIDRSSSGVTTRVL
jgi:hypothetical protein